MIISISGRQKRRLIRPKKHSFALLLLAAILILRVLAGTAQAQQPQQFQPGVEQPGAFPANAQLNIDTGPPPWRLHFVILDQYFFDSHPFYQLTGSSGYASGKSPGSSSYAFGHYTDKEEDLLTRIAHNIPAFAVEGIKTFPIFIPKGIAFGFSHMTFAQADVEAADSSSTVLGIQMDVYMYVGYLKFFAFDPTEPGLNYFFGIGSGILEGRIGQLPYSSETITFRQNPIGIKFLGLDSKGENWGFRYELMLLNAKNVKLAKSLDTAYYPTSPAEIDFSGTIIRMSVSYEFN